ncbi:glutaredoxin family protein [Arthrobacter sp. FW306-2-2C-D06B]|uniref:glutaredoxin family protein n=1 Tax=Arthrobacter sp. FW306-2-2C-D06B TaxID=2879618 RepID=UPI001F32D366|nr:glutaredoxin family protein [Arthrobacter sp. FW306-2-2C-D06B]UKA59190.1 glutaredoxin family protein [Arthrobacter sp. FW306-2-2C-D06B]
MTTEAIDLTARIQARDGVAVVVYTKNDCRQCDMTKGLLTKEGVHFTSVNVEEDATAYRYVTETLGIRQMPVVITSTLEGEEVWSGFQPAKIREHITHRADAA